MGRGAGVKCVGRLLRNICWDTEKDKEIADLFRTNPGIGIDCELSWAWTNRSSLHPDVEG